MQAGRPGRVGWWVAVAGVVLAVALPFVAALGWDDYEHRSQYISELGAVGAPNGLAVSAGFFVVGVLFLAWAALTAPGMATAAGVTGAATAVAVWLAGGGIGAAYAVSAVARCEPGCPDEDVGTAQAIHSLVSGIGISMAVSALVVFGVAVLRAPRARVRRVGLVGLVVAPGLAALGVAVLVSDDWRGLLQRLLDAGLFAWVLGISWLTVAGRQDAVRLSAEVPVRSST